MDVKKEVSSWLPISIISFTAKVGVQYIVEDGIIYIIRKEKNDKKIN